MSRSSGNSSNGSGSKGHSKDGGRSTGGYHPGYGHDLGGGGWGAGGSPYGRGDNPAGTFSRDDRGYNHPGYGHSFGGGNSNNPSQAWPSFWNQPTNTSAAFANRTIMTMAKQNGAFPKTLATLFLGDWVQMHVNALYSLSDAFIALGRPIVDPIAHTIAAWLQDNYGWGYQGHVVEASLARAANHGYPLGGANTQTIASQRAQVQKEIDQVTAVLSSSMNVSSREDDGDDFYEASSCPTPEQQQAIQKINQWVDLRGKEIAQLSVLHANLVNAYATMSNTPDDIFLQLGNLMDLGRLLCEFSERPGSASYSQEAMSLQNKITKLNIDFHNKLNWYINLPSIENGFSHYMRCFALPMAKAFLGGQNPSYLQPFTIQMAYHWKNIYKIAFDNAMNALNHFSQLQKSGDLSIETLTAYMNSIHGNVAYADISKLYQFILQSTELDPYDKFFQSAYKQVSESFKLDSSYKNVVYQILNLQNLLSFTPVNKVEAIKKINQLNQALNVSLSFVISKNSAINALYEKIEHDYNCDNNNPKNVAQQIANLENLISFTPKNEPELIKKISDLNVSFHNRLNSMLYPVGLNQQQSELMNQCVGESFSELATQSPKNVLTLSPKYAAHLANVIMLARKKFDSQQHEVIHSRRAQMRF